MQPHQRRCKTMYALPLLFIKARSPAYVILRMSFVLTSMLINAIINVMPFHLSISAVLRLPPVPIFSVSHHPHSSMTSSYHGVIVQYIEYIQALDTGTLKLICHSRMLRCLIQYSPFPSFTRLQCLQLVLSCIHGYANFGVSIALSHKYRGPPASFFVPSPPSTIGL